MTYEQSQKWNSFEEGAISPMTSLDSVDLDSLREDQPEILDGLAEQTWHKPSVKDGYMLFRNHVSDGMEGTSSVVDILNPD